MQIVTTANVRYDVIYEKGDYKIGVKLLMNFTEKKTLNLQIVRVSCHYVNY